MNKTEKDILENYNEKDKYSFIKKHLFLFSFISGLFCALSMPGLNIGIIAWISFIPLILIIANTESFKKALLYPLAFGLGFNLISLNWFLGLHPLNWLDFSEGTSFFLTRAIWLYVSTYASYYFAIFGLSAYFILKLKQGIVIKSLLISILWSLIMNKLMASGEFAFPWAMIQYSQYKNLALLQLAQYIGGIGIGFIIIFTNTLIAFIVYQYLNKNIELKPAYTRITSIIIVLIMIHLSGIYILKYKSKPDKFMDVAVIQGNISVEKEKQDLLSIDGTKTYYINQIKKAPSGLIVVPETAIYELMRYRDINLYNELAGIARDQNKTLIIGTVDMTINKGKLAPTNSAIIFDKQNLINNVYHKQKLVPFGEYTPFAEYIPEWLMRFTSTAVKGDYVSGKTTLVSTTSIGKVAPSICYEIVFPEIARMQVQNNAEVLVDLSNLSWFHDSIIKDQFVAFSVMRAAESRRPFVLSVNTGRSAIISFTGKILKELDKNSSGIISTKVGYRNEKSLFSRSFL